MATAAIDQNPTPPAAAPEEGAEAPAKGSKKMVLILAAVGVVAGGAAGAFALGPMLAKSSAKAPPAAEAGEHGAEGAGAATAVYKIENLVLNPAGSDGKRFLMVSATFQVKGDVEPKMKERDAEIRDRILAILGQKTVEDLTDITRRETIKAEVLGIVSALFAKGEVTKLFFPQFVIQ
jgi:flagellar FliL protein